MTSAWDQPAPEPAPAPRPNVAGMDLPALRALVTALGVADPGQAQAPGQAAGEGVEVEAGAVHPGDAGGQGDEGADHRQHPAQHDGPVAEALEEPVGLVQVLQVQQDVAAVALHRLAPAPGAEFVGRDGAEVAADRAEHPGDRDLGRGMAGPPAQERHLAPEGQEAGEGHDHLAGQRNAGALDGHQHRDPPWAHGHHEGGHPGDDGGKQLMQHGNSRLNFQCIAMALPWFPWDRELIINLFHEREPEP